MQRKFGVQAAVLSAGAIVATVVMPGGAQAFIDVRPYVERYSPAPVQSIRPEVWTRTAADEQSRFQDLSAHAQRDSDQILTDAGASDARSDARDDEKKREDRIELALCLLLAIDQATGTAPSLDAGLEYFGQYQSQDQYAYSPANPLVRAGLGLAIASSTLDPAYFLPHSFGMPAFIQVGSQTGNVAVDVSSLSLLDGACHRNLVKVTAQLNSSWVPQFTHTFAITTFGV